MFKKDKTIQDRGIYEMRYEPKNPTGYQWIPLRVRDDKTRPNIVLLQICMENYSISCFRKIYNRQRFN